jgi:glycosyltransferase involved in cell wall biosynthesis
MPFDVLHGMWADEPGFVATTAARLLRVPSVVSLLGGELVGMPEIGYGGQLSRANRTLTRVALRAASRVTVGSAFLRDIAEQRVAPERLTTLPFGVDGSRFSADGDVVRLIGDPALLHVASLVPVKDQAMLLRAFVRMRDDLPNAHLHILGDGVMRDDLARLAASLGMTDAVTFHGAVDHGALAGHYRGADACLLTSRYESQGMVVLEAAACGSPTFGTSVGLLPEFWSAMPTVPVGDDCGLAEAVVAATRADDLAAMGRRARRIVGERYGLEQAVARLDGLYRDLNTG